MAIIVITLGAILLGNVASRTREPPDLPSVQFDGGSRIVR